MHPDEKNREALLVGRVSQGLGSVVFKTSAELHIALLSLYFLKETGKVLFGSVQTFSVWFVSHAILVMCVIYHFRALAYVRCANKVIHLSAGRTLKSRKMDASIKIQITQNRLCVACPAPGDHQR